LLLGHEQVAQLLCGIHHVLRGCPSPARLAWTGVNFAESGLTQSHALWNRPWQVDLMNELFFFVRLRSNAFSFSPLGSCWRHFSRKKEKKGFSRKKEQARDSSNAMGALR
jgi:hypothetical protein